jgi:hypothetical protein
MMQRREQCARRRPGRRDDNPAEPQHKAQFEPDHLASQAGEFGCRLTAQIRDFSCEITAQPGNLSFVPQMRRGGIQHRLDPAKRLCQPPQSGIEIDAGFARAAPARRERSIMLVTL